MHSSELLDASRLLPQHFTRERKLPFPLLLTSLLGCMTASVHTELMSFFANLDNRADLLAQVSKQAFSQARQKFSAHAFTLLNRQLIAAADDPARRWRGWRLVAADATVLSLTSRKLINRATINATGFALYLPGQELTLDFELYATCVSERQMLFEHLDSLCADDLLLLDRGYPCRWLAAVLSQRKCAFCMRVDHCGFAAARQLLSSDLDELQVDLRPPTMRDAADYECERTPTTVRFIKTVSPDGAVRVVMTNLLDAEGFPVKLFSELYHQRWRIEEAFKRLKCRLHLESITGDNWLAATQDFGAKIVADNLHALCVHAAGETLTETGDDGSHEKINRTTAAAILKRCLPAALLWPDKAMERLLAALKQLTLALIRFIPNMRKPRPRRVKPHDRMAYKSMG